MLANNPLHLAGAIDAGCADKAARFMQLCEAFDLPLLFLCDTPGFMVGPEAEETALVRHVSRMFVTGASLTVPFCTVILRKGYGLGAQAMAGGSFRRPLFTVAWPTGELGGMGLEGAVRLGFRRELDAIADPAAREEALPAWSNGPTRTGRRSTWRSTSRSTTSSTRRTRGTGWSMPCGRHRHRRRARGSDVPSSIRGEANCSRMTTAAVASLRNGDDQRHDGVALRRHPGPPLLRRRLEQRRAPPCWLLWPWRRGLWWPPAASAARPTGIWFLTIRAIAHEGVDT